MIGNSRLLALVVARGGSVRLPKKNVSLLGGIPLIVWSIKAATGTNCVDRVVVSTDDDEISQIARSSGGEVLFKRPKHLATDSATSIDVVSHALNELRKQGEWFQFVLLIQPTSPFRDSIHIEQAVALLQSKNADAVIGVTKLDHPVEWSNSLPDDLSMDKYFRTGFEDKRSQELPVRYRVNGAIYLARVDRLFEERTFFFPTKTFAYKMDRKASIDIDTLDDLTFAELFLNDSRLSNNSMKI